MSAAVLPLVEAPSIPIVWGPGIRWDPDATRELVEDVLTAGAMSITYGESNSGKTTTMLDLAIRMTLGLPWLGKRLEQRAVVYVAAESPPSVYRRVEAFRRHHGVEIKSLGVIPAALSLIDPSADVENLIELVLDHKARAPRPVGLIVVDTMARVMVGANENAVEDMSRVISAGDALRTATGAHVNFVHHSGKDVSKGARGHSSLNGAIDTEIEVVADEALGRKVLTITKQRDLTSKGLQLSARFQGVELGRNQWDKPITACVVEPLEEPSPHIKAVMLQVEAERAETAVLAGLRAARAMGIFPSDVRNASGYLPRVMLEKQLATGFDKEQLAAAVNRLMGRGVLRRGIVGRDSSRHQKEGLLLAAEVDA